MINLFIGNLPAGATEQELRAVFATFGEVVRVLFVNDRATGRPRDFCFVDLEGLAPGVEDRWKGTTLRGHPLEVIEAISPAGWRLA